MLVFQDSGWSTAIATWALFVVTLAAVIVGSIAALSASRTYELESQPVILIRQLEREESVGDINPARLLLSFMVAPKPTLSEGIELRRPFPNDASDANANLNRSAILEIQNLGRSPALDVQLPFAVSAPYMGKQDLDLEAGFTDLKTQKGSGNIALPGIAPNATVYVLVDSLIGVQVTLKAADFGTYMRIEGRKKKEHPLAIISLSEMRIPQNW